MVGRLVVPRKQQIKHDGCLKGHLSVYIHSDLTSTVAILKTSYVKNRRG